ncbi:hypothetical protein BRADI_1g53645v3 [Brachypodium distachyon]|uniref:Uncharacterized protein n=1 Tax=Brachypodium distachyon TaxID=15368 RepID=A0A2K2DR89_BRADI|nr:hypothetical protein BRADI_1g53645v3 [Brachypodium distachyon]
MSQLKHHVPPYTPVSYQVPPDFTDAEFLLVPDRILQRSLIKCSNRAAPGVLSSGRTCQNPWRLGRVWLICSGISLVLWLWNKSDQSQVVASHQEDRRAAVNQE